MTVMAGAIVAPALTNMAAYFTDASDVLIKLIITMPALVIAILGTFVGSLSDRFGRKRILTTALVIYGISGFSAYFIDNIYLLLFSRTILGVGVAGIMSMSTTLIGDYFKGAERSAFMGKQSAFIAAGGVVFLLLAGSLADINWRLPFSLYLMSLVLLPFVVLIIYEPIKIDKTLKGSEAARIDKPLIAFIYLLAFFGMIFFYMVPTQIPFLLKSKLDVNNTFTGIAIATSTLMGSISSINYGRIKRKLRFRTIYALAFFVMAIGYSIIAFAENYTVILMGLAVSGLAMGMFIPNSNLWLMEIVPIAKRGKIIGGSSSVMFLGQFLSPLLVSLLLGEFNMIYAFYGASIFMVLISITLLLSRKKINDA